MRTTKDSFWSLMLHPNKIPFFWLQLTKAYAIRAYFGRIIFRAHCSIINFVIDKIAFKSAIVKRVKGKEFGQGGLRPELNIFNIDPKIDGHSIGEKPVDILPSRGPDLQPIAAVENDHFVGLLVHAYLTVQKGLQIGALCTFNMLMVPNRDLLSITPSSACSSTISFFIDFSMSFWSVELILSTWSSMVSSLLNTT